MSMRNLIKGQASRLTNPSFPLSGGVEATSAILLYPVTWEPPLLFYSDRFNYRALRILGSNTSRNPSPIKFHPIEKRMIAMIRGT